MGSTIFESQGLDITHSRGIYSTTLIDTGQDPWEKWDDFVEYVPKLLEEHPTLQVDNVIALKLGSSIYSHYKNWKVDPMNIANSLPEKVGHLFDYWKQQRKHQSLKALVTEL